MLFTLVAGDQTLSPPSEIHYLVSLCCLRGKNLMRERMRTSLVPSHVLITFFLAGRLHYGGFPVLTEQIFSLLFVSHLEAISFAFFLSGIDLYWFLAMLCHALISGCSIFTDSDFLTLINMIKSGGVCRTERLLPHNVKYRLFWLISS